MARFRLRYRSTDLEMPLGDFVVGRSSTCNLALDDGLVSRRHALLRVTKEALTVEDLGSRNGVSVNGEQVEGRKQLKHLDRITIGNQEMVVLEKPGTHTNAQTVQFERCWACGALCEPQAKNCLQCGAQIRQERQTLAGENVTIKSFPDFGSGEDESTQTTTSFSLLAPIAEKALQLGRYEEASRLLGPSLDRLKQKAESGEEKDGKLLDRGIQLALRVSEGPTAAARWIPWVFDMHTILEKPMKSDVVDRLHELVRRARYSNPKPLRKYLSVLRKMDLKPADRFLVRRLEALERVITA